MHTVSSKSPDVAFTIKCDGCELPVIRLGEEFRPPGYRNIDVDYECLLVEGYRTPTHNIKYFPARAGLRWAQKEGLAGPGKQILVPSSGNALISTDYTVKSEEIDLELIGVVSSKLPAGKRDDLEKRNIRMITELDLAKSLDRKDPGEMFEMLEAYSKLKGIPVLHQYNCDQQGGWNFKSYLPMAESIMRQTGGRISIFSATAGTKGKLRGIGTKISGKVVAVFPYPGHSFPGGRDEEGIEHVGNSFGLEPIKRTLNHLVAYHYAGYLYAAGVPAGITAAAELATGQHLSLEYVRGSNRPREIAFDKKITILVVASDTIGPYIKEGMEYVPHLFQSMVDPRLIR